jgi:hypothetical protein
MLSRSVSMRDVDNTFMLTLRESMPPGHGLSIVGMPPLEVSRGIDGELVINDGVTRATRVAKYLPGELVTVEVTGRLPVAVGGLPKVRERL